MFPYSCHEYHNVTYMYLLQIKNSKTTAVMTSIKVIPLTIPARVPSKIKHNVRLLNVKSEQWVLLAQQLFTMLKLSNTDLYINW